MRLAMTDLFIRRPVFSSVLSLLLLIMGLIAYQQLNVRQFPKIDANVITITTYYDGANASIVESFITRKIEDSIQGVDNIDYITSSSTDGKSQVTLNLKINSDINAAMIDVESDLSKILSKLPDGVDDPTIKKVDIDSIPELILNFNSNNMSQEAISDYLTRVIVPQLSNIDGIGSVDVLGDRIYAMRIWLNASKMAQLNISQADIETVLQNKNIQAQPGKIDRKWQLMYINAQTDLSTSDEFANLIVKNDGANIVRLKDIAKVELGAESYDTTMYANGHFSVGVAVTAKSNANPLSVANEVKASLKTLEKTLPSGMKVSIPRDSSIYIQRSITEVIHSIFEAAVGVIIVIFLFIGSIRSIIIPIVTIPLSLISVFSFMHGLHYSINTMTLLAFVLAIGMVVDDAIVVVENVHRHMEQGMSAYTAAIQGSKEIGFAIIAMTLTLAAVYTPIGFTVGLTGALFREFAFTLACTVIISGFVALTLSPMMCSKLMRPSDLQHVKKLTHYYHNLLDHVLNHRSIVIAIMLTVLIAGLMLFLPLYQKSGLAPDEDQGVVIGRISAPTSANVAYTQKFTNELAKIYETIPENAGYVIINGHPDGQNSGMTILNLTNWSSRDRASREIITELNKKTNQITGIRVLMMNPPSLPGTQQLYPIQFVVTTTGSYKELSNITEKIMYDAEKNPGFSRVQNDLKLDKPEFDIEIDRSKAAALGIFIDDIATTLKIAFGEPETTDFSVNGLSYEVIPQMQWSNRNSENAIDQLSVKTASGSTVPLSSIVNIKPKIYPSSLNHFQGQRSSTISATLNAGYSTNQAILYLQQLAKKYLTDNMSFGYAGSTREFIEANTSMLMIFSFAIIFIYLILSAQFESFTDPLIILLSVPLSSLGALIAILFSGGSLNIYTEIALVTLIGLISKHGILIVEFANQLQAQGRSIQQAALESASIRLRPILMTTAAMILGALPLIIASGAGAAARREMGWAIGGGMAIGTLLTLLVVPTMYTFLAKKYNGTPNG